MAKIIALTMTMFLVGCATAPQVFEVKNSRTYAVSKEVIWDRLIRYFATSNIQVKTVERDSGIIYAEKEINGNVPVEWSVRGRVGDGLADCGKDIMATPAAQSIQFNVYVRDLGAAASSATVTASFRESYQGMNTLYGYYSPPAPRACNSTGVLEGLILDQLDRR